MRYSLIRARQIPIVKELPGPDAVLAQAAELIRDMKALAAAEAINPCSGPAILDPEVAGVFFHEALGHRLEGERQRDEFEGGTFKEKVGEKVLPVFLSVIDDPTLSEFQGTALAGHYRYDSEGIRAQRVQLVKDGILKNYLMSRTPIKDFPHSNGHGRCAGGNSPTARMAVLCVESSKALPLPRLKEELLAECQRLGKSHGFIIQGIDYGSTNTIAYSYQAFSAMPKRIWRVDAGTGAEILVRGLELVGTPLASLNKVIATGDDASAINAFCTAESGTIPITHIAPSILTSEVEFQKASGEKNKPPILPPP